MSTATDVTRRSPPTPESRRIGWIALVLVAAVFYAYQNSWHGPFIHDDMPAIRENSTIRTLWPLGPVLLPPEDMTVSGRPLLNLSLALNYASGGLRVEGYHVVNVLIHTLAGLVLFGLTRRVLARRGAGDPTWIGGAIAAAWLLHPLQTESVSYVVQRAESLMGLFLWLTLYGFVRGHSSPGSVRWRIISVVACFAGMATKENMVSAPLLVLLLDRACLAGSVRATWRARRGYYLALASSWLLLGALVASTGGNRGGSVGFGTQVSFVSYWLTQFPAWTRYLSLSMWPESLVFDYGTFWIDRPVAILPHATVVIILLGASFYALWRKPLLGFLAAVFCALLAPTSLMPGTTQMIVEHRMYVSLAPLLALLVFGLHQAIGRRGLPLLLAASVPLALLTRERNEVYRSELALWSDTVTKRPQNPQARFHLGNALVRAGRVAEALPHYQHAVALAPGYAEAHNNLGNALRRLARPADALRHYEESLRLAPNVAETHNNAANALAQIGRAADAIAHYRRALALKPDYAEAHANLANAFAQRGDFAQAGVHFERALRARPDFAEACFDYGVVLHQQGRVSQAVVQFERAIALRPQYVEAHYNYAAALYDAGRPSEARRHFETALRLRPDFEAAREALAQLRGQP